MQRPAHDGAHTKQMQMASSLSELGKVIL